MVNTKGAILSKSKRLIYLLLFVFLLSSVESPFQNGLYLLFIIMLYIDAKDPNMRVLLVLLTLTSALFYEVDYLLYYILATAWEPNEVLRDLVLNASIILCFISYILVIFYREEIYDYFADRLALKPIIFVPTEADAIQLTISKLGLTYHIVMTAYLTHIGIDYMLLSEHMSTSQLHSAKENFKQVSQWYVDWGIKIELIRQFSIVVVAHAWTKKNSKRLLR